MEGNLIPGKIYRIASGYKYKFIEFKYHLGTQTVTFMTPLFTERKIPMSFKYNPNYTWYYFKEDNNLKLKFGK